MTRRYWVWSPTMGVPPTEAMELKAASPLKAAHKFCDHADDLNDPARDRLINGSHSQVVVVKCGDPFEAPHAPEHRFSVLPVRTLSFKITDLEPDAVAYG